MPPAEEESSVNTVPNSHHEALLRSQRRRRDAIRRYLAYRDAVETRERVEKHTREKLESAE